MTTRILSEPEAPGSLQLGEAARSEPVAGGADARPSYTLAELQIAHDAFIDDIVSSRQAATAGVRPSRAKTIRSTAIVVSDSTAFLLSIVIGLAFAAIVRPMFVEDPRPTMQSSSLSEAVTLFLTLAALLFWKSWSSGHYTRFRPVWTELREVLHVVVQIGAAGAVLMFAFKLNFSRLWLGSFLLSLCVLIPSARLIARQLMIRADVWFKPTYIVGTGDNAIMTASALSSDVSMGHEIKGFLDFSASGAPSTLAGKPVFSRMTREVMDRDAEPPCLVFAFDSLGEIKKCRRILNKYIAQSSHITIAPPINGLPLCGAEIVNVFRHDAVLLKLQNNINNPRARIGKRLCDLVLSGLALTVLSPLMLVLYWLIGRDGGSPIYAHRRVGKDGKEFSCLKFRSMTARSDEVLARHLEENPIARAEWEETRKLADDPRVTRVGRFLRRSSLDELPQLLNVLRGQMSIVGPRPIVTAEKYRYGEYLPYYLAMVPGITGLWQSSGRSTTTYRDRVLMDVWYARNWSMWHDVVIILRTVPSLFASRGAC